MSRFSRTLFAGRTTSRIDAVCIVKAQALWRSFDRSLFFERLMRHLQRWSLVYLTCAVAILWFDTHYTVALNVTESLPHRLFLIHRSEMPKRGDLVAFRWMGGGPYPVGATFIKVVAGMPGDAVTQVDHDYFVNGYPVGRAKRMSRQGVELEPGPTGTLPAGAYYMRAPHPDSLDSRYALTGWVSQTQIIGRAHALF
ncbi:S26 family signal peptidase [Candidatus Skiveiella danica]|uniref:S26 family signal peptidase n=1 Tax=Candidatus Skiveiella danica TaxID=3386177 RepID=UPI0009D2D94F|nr:MAG: Peptidase S26 [Alphaproteobacteria bacterium ADurb.Bin100]